MNSEQEKGDPISDESQAERPKATKPQQRDQSTQDSGCRYLLVWVGFGAVLGGIIVRRFM